MMLSCKEVSKRLSESLDRRLPLGVRFGLWLHLSMCRICRGFRKDLLHLHHQTRRLAGQIESPTVEPSVNLPVETRERIKRRLEVSP